MKNLENYGVLELNAKEIRETDGGGFFVILGIVVVATYLGHLWISNSRKKNERNGHSTTARGTLTSRARSSVRRRR
ncbi:MAG: Uncharacterised protein [Formosa sp. Hel1_33_131]|nr:MAG: Uncharacterised protein [Formosa sp. Hel1_33_131]